MKIWGEIPKVLGVYDNLKSAGKVDKTAGTASKRDVLSLSNQAKDYQTALKAVKEIPDIRLDKVSELAEKYRSGNYTVSGSEVADKIISSIVDKKV
ncbi:MAG: flagellar biosynthesis anti-sigma factor FlgM [Clostridiales bacterium]|jgi:negative regulator of flagellin synthesis FlgM|nr:flagellar biosynthesis anti-sigma factor FlgM [Eubacteriales bacterium]MDH7566174.1 flagellar biosynthesis anti-sigma factor FlgM [Clostridiales bacterium]